MENAKSMLHAWMNTKKIKAEYKYSATGPSHNTSFIAEMGFYVNELKRNIHAREGGSNKQSASKSCALSLVRQLFHLGVFEVRDTANIHSTLYGRSDGSYHKDTEPLYHSFMYSLVSLLSGIYPLPAMHSLLVTS